MLNESLVFDISFAEALEQHYALAGPYMERLFAGIPFVWTTLPRGLKGPKIYHGPLSSKTRPKAPIVDVRTRHGIERYPAFSTERVTGLVAHGAIEVYSWSPVAKDPTRARFGRILLEVTQDAGADGWLKLEDGMDAVEGVLYDLGVKSIRVYDGGTGVAIWIPFADLPPYDVMRTWLHAICERAVQEAPDKVTLEPNSHGGPPVHLHAQSNAVGRIGIMPYSVRASAGFPIAMPIDNAMLADDSGDFPFVNGNVTIGNLAKWLDGYGDMLARQDAAFWSQTFAAFACASPSMPLVSSTTHRMTGGKSRGPIVSAAIAMLQDGRSHSADEILAWAERQRLLDSSVTRKYVYTSLIEYIARTNGNGHKPAIAQNADRTFRINEPPDDWPELKEEPAPAVDAEIQALIDRLATTASGSSPEAFELAVCDAFSALGFTTTHVGGQTNTDGYADAPLGTLGYRFTIECKSADEGIHHPSVFEAAKFKDAYGAQYCALVARALTSETEFTSELHNHGVSAWTIDDLATLLRLGANPLEIKSLFAPGFAADALDDLVWERRHGRVKRVQLIADAILRTGWTTQQAYHGDPTQAPRLTEDVAMVLVNQDLAAQGSDATCSRDDVRAALDYLSNPLTGGVTAQGDAFIVTGPGIGSV